MADSIGEFSFNHTGNAYAKNDDDVVVAFANYEGTATGFGTVMGTLAFPLSEQGATSGTVTWTGQGFPPDRPAYTSFGEGTWDQVEGSYAWKISLPSVEFSDETNSLRAEGVVDLEARTFNGQMFEA
jgi:hypothetical protein